MERQEFCTAIFELCILTLDETRQFGRVQLKPDGTRWRTGGEVKGKLANGVGSQYSHTTSERGVSSITTADAHTSAASSRLNWRPRRFKWTRPFRWKTKSGFCACAITFQTQSTATMYVLFGLTTCTAHGTQLQITFVVNQTSLAYHNSLQLRLYLYRMQ
jgi:hypothetical protein